MYSRPAGLLSIGGVLDDGFRLYKSSIGPLYSLALCAVLVTNSPALLLVRIADPANPRDFADLLPLVFLGLPLIVLLSSIFYAAIIARIHGIAGQIPMTFGQALTVGFRRAIPIFMGSLLYGLAVLVGMILLVVPGLILGVSMFFMSVLVVVEGKGAIASLEGSHRLVSGLWWHTATVLTVAFVIATVPFFVASFIAGLLTAPFMTAATLVRWTAINVVVSSVIYAFLLPILFCLQYSLYRDLLLRKGGSDLERRLENVTT